MNRSNKKNRNRPHSFLVLVLILVLPAFVLAVDREENILPPSAPTNRANIQKFFDEYKNALETKNVDKYLGCFSLYFSKEMIDTSEGYTNKFFLTYDDIEKGVKEDNFSAYQGRTVKVSIVIKSIKFNLLEARTELDMVIQLSGAEPKTEKRKESFLLEWNREKLKWELVSF